MTSDFEGWPMTMFEAMQKGCVPVVYNSFSSLLDIIDNKENGYIIPNNDKSEFESSTITLARNPNIQNKMSFASIYKAAHFDVPVIVKDWMHLLNT